MAMRMSSGVRSISKLRHLSPSQAQLQLLLSSPSLSNTTINNTTTATFNFAENPIETIPAGKLYCKDSRIYHTCSLRDSTSRALEVSKRQYLRRYYGDVDFDLDVDGLADEQITFPEFSAKGELVRWEKAKFIAGSALSVDHTPSIGYLNIWEGSGEFFADKGDKVRVQYKCYDMSCHIDHEKLPHDMTLGQAKHGQGLDEGIYGMRSGGRRRIAIPQILCATSNNKYLRKLAEFWHNPEDYKIFDVILLDIDKGI